MQEHKASSEATDALRANVSAAVDEGGLIHRFQQWLTLHQKQLLLWQAKQAAESAAALLSARHNEIAAQIDSRKNSPAQANGPANTNQPAAKAAAPPQLSHEDSAELVKATKLRAAKQKAMSAFDKRMDDQKQLADNYGKWIRVIAAKQKAEFHRALIGVIVILGILLIGVFFDSWLEKLLGKTALDRKWRPCEP
jgi:hypothetical protein